MAPKKNSTPIKPLEGSTVTHEDEEWQHDISKLQEQVQQISLSQRTKKNEMEVLKKGMETKMDGLNKGMEAKMNGLEDNMDGMEVGMEAKMDVMEAKMDEMEAKIDEKIKDNMENMKNDLAKLIQEMFPNGENIVKETHDENKINVNHDLINSNVECKNHHIPKMDMKKFDGKDPLTWILQMEQYFDLSNVKNNKRCALQLYI